MQSVLSRASQLAKLQSIIDVAEDFTGLLSSEGASVPEFTRQLSDGDSAVNPLFEDLLLALATHSDLAAYSLIPKLLDTVPKHLLESVHIVAPTLPLTENLPELAFGEIAMPLNESIVWRLALYRLIGLFSIGTSDEGLKSNFEVLIGDLAKQPSK